MPIFREFAKNSKCPQISILAAGDELVPVGTTHHRGDIVNSNHSALSALVNLWSGTVHMSDLTKGDPEAIPDRFKRASNVAIIVLVGGASKDDHDHMRRVFTDIGKEMILKIAVRSDKPKAMVI